MKNGGESVMAKVCDICGKGPVSGNRIIRHGLAKKKGGIGLHTTGITPRRFIPNLRKMRILEAGNPVTKKVCMSCLKTGRLIRA
jgi:large subunit ribosomal protein L28